MTSKPSIFAPSTLAGRLLLSACLFVTAALVAAGLVIAVILHYVVTDQVEQRLQAQASSLASAVTIDSKGDISIAPGFDAPPFDRRGSGWHWQIAVGEQILRSRSLGDAGLNAPPQPFDWRHLFSGRAQAVEGRDAKGRSLHIITLTTSRENTPVAISVSAPTSAISDPLKRALLWLIPSIGVLGLALIAATLLQIRLGLKPLQTLRDDLQDVRTGTKSRVPMDQPAELAPVVEELNALIGQNEERLAGARLHLANMAHSLKTPLASLSLAVREGDRDPAGTLAALTDQIEARIRHHLSRARANTAAGHNRAQTAVAHHLTDLTDVMQKIYGDRGLTLVMSVDPSLKVACEEQDFDELAGNLIDNAFKWARTRVSIKAATDNGKILIDIEDDGPGIPDDALESVLLPGQRLDETVPGHGFGLSVSRELISLYGGSLRLGAGGATGLRATVELPAA